MKHLLLFFTILFFSSNIFSQSASIKEVLQSPDEESIVFANVALYNISDSSLVKAETSNETVIILEIRK